MPFLTSEQEEKQQPRKTHGLRKGSVESYLPTWSQTSHSFLPRMLLHPAQIVMEHGLRARHCSPETWKCIPFSKDISKKKYIFSKYTFLMKPRVVFTELSTSASSGSDPGSEFSLSMRSWSLLLRFHTVPSTQFHHLPSPGEWH